jgi:mono/diheme cytochrome c family protein
MIALVLLLARAALPSPAPVPKTAELPAAAGVTPGDETFGHRCTGCHGGDGKGHTPRGQQLETPDFTSAAWQKRMTDQDIIRVITFGNKKRGMLPFDDRLSAAEIAAMVPFLRSLGAGQK